MNKESDLANHADVDRQLAQDEFDRAKRPWELRKLRLDVVGSVLGWGFGLSAAGGALLLFVYFARNGFSAGGISAADTVSLALLFLGFAIATSIVLIYATFAAYPTIRILSPVIALLGRSKRRVLARLRRDSADDGPYLPVRVVWPSLYSGSMAVGLVALIFYAIFIWVTPASVRFALVSFLAAGAFICTISIGTPVQLFSVWPRKRSENPIDVWMASLSFRARQRVAVGIVTLSVIVVYGGVAQDMSMIMMGLRKHNVTVRLSKEDFSYIADRAMRAGLVINPCEAIDPNTFVLTRVDVLWHKLGTQALLRYPSRKLGTDDDSPAAVRELRVDVNNSTMSVLADGRASVYCDEVLVSSVFEDADNAQLSERGRLLLQRQMHWLDFLPIGSRVKVTARDSNLATGAKGQGPSLSVRQAMAVKFYIESQFHLRPSIVDAVGREDAIAKRDCTQVDGEHRVICEDSNRRVEITALPITR